MHLSLSPSMYLSSLSLSVSFPSPPSHIPVSIPLSIYPSFSLSIYPSLSLSMYPSPSLVYPSIFPSLSFPHVTSASDLHYRSLSNSTIIISRYIVFILRWGRRHAVSRRKCVRFMVQSRQCNSIAMMTSSPSFLVNTVHLWAVLLQNKIAVNIVC